MQIVSRVEERVQLRMVLRIPQERVKVDNSIKRARVANEVVDLEPGLFTRGHGIGLICSRGRAEGRDGGAEDGDAEGVHACHHLLVGLCETL